jgi:copper(I)-binding protein
MSLAATLMIASSVRAVAALNAIVRAAPRGGDAEAHLVLTNLAGQNRLVEITCDCAERVEIRQVETHGDRRVLLAVPTVEMPPSRLIEFTPGGSRYLVLVGLRRPLVSGESVELRFHYEQGSSSERFRIVEDTGAAWAATVAQQRGRGMEAFEFVAGSCWRGTFPNGRQTDTHCFSPIYAGTYMQDRHVVEGGTTPYSGDTLFRRDAMSRQVRFTYHASDGSVTQGQAIPIEGGLNFPEEHRAADGTVTPIRTTWMRDGDNAYFVTSEAQREGAWRPMFRMRMERVRVGSDPAP